MTKATKIIVTTFCILLALTIITVFVWAFTKKPDGKRFDIVCKEKVIEEAKIVDGSTYFIDTNRLGNVGIPNLSNKDVYETTIYYGDNYSNKESYIVEIEYDGIQRIYFDDGDIAKIIVTKIN